MGRRRDPGRVTDKAPILFRHAKAHDPDALPRRLPELRTVTADLERLLDAPTRVGVPSERSIAQRVLRDL